MSDKIKFKFPDNPNGGKNIFTNLEEKIELSEDDELLLNNQGRIRKIKALQFKGEKGDKGERGFTGDRGPQGLKGEPGNKGEKGETGEMGLRGEKGLPGETGPKGEKGEAFKFSDFTPEQLEALKVKGDKGEVGPPGPRGQKGDKGEPGDTGPVGPAGRDGTGTGDMLASNNLSDLSNKEAARNNLDVYKKSDVFTKYETGKKIENEVKKFGYIDFNNLENKPDLENLLNGKVDKISGKVLSDNNFTNAEKQKLASLNNSPTIDESNLVHKNGDEVISGSKTFEKRGGTAGVKFKNLNTNKTYEIGVNTGGEFILWDTQNSKNRIRSKDNWFEIGAIPTTTEGQSDWGHSLTRKDYVDRKIREISNSGGLKKVFDSGLNYGSAEAVYRHNLNLSKEDYLSGKYLIILISENEEYIDIATSDTTRMQRFGTGSYRASTFGIIYVMPNEVSAYFGSGRKKCLIFKRF